MIHKTKGIALSYVKFRESSIVTRIYTRKFGLQGYVVNGVRSSKSKKGLAFFQPLTLLDLVVYHRPNADLNRLSEFKIEKPYSSIPFNHKKTTMSLFLVEFLSKVMNDETNQEDQFDFVHQSMEILDAMNSQYENFHLQFIIKLSRYLGHGISDFEDLSRHTVIAAAADDMVEFFQNLLNATYDEFIKSHGHERSQALKILLEYYGAFHDGWSDMKSLKVLNEVFH